MQDYDEYSQAAAWDSVYAGEIRAAAVSPELDHATTSARCLNCNSPMGAPEDDATEAPPEDDDHDPFYESCQWCCHRDKSGTMPLDGEPGAAHGTWHAVVRVSHSSRRGVFERKVRGVPTEVPMVVCQDGTLIVSLPFAAGGCNEGTAGMKTIQMRPDLVDARRGGHCTKVEGTSCTCVEETKSPSIVSTA